MVKNYKNLLLGSLVLSASGVMAQELTSEKRAPLQKILPNSFSKAEAYQKHDAPGVAEAGNKAGFEYILGSTFFDKRMEVEVTLGVHKLDTDAKINTSEIVVESKFTAVDFNEKMLTLAPYVKVELPTQNDQLATNGRFGAIFASSHTMATDYGVFGIRGYYDGAAEFSRSPDRVEITRDGEPVSANDPSLVNLGLLTNASGNLTAAPQALNTRHEAGLELTYGADKFVNGLSFKSKTRRRINGKPMMEYDLTEKRVIAKTYAAGIQQYNNIYRDAEVLTAKYMINDTFYVKNDFTLYLKQVENQTGDKKFAYENLITLGANLF